MAQQLFSRAASTLLRGAFIVSRSQFLAALIVALGLVAARPSPALSQTAPQQYVYGSVPVTTTSSKITGYVKNSQTGALSAAAGSPFADPLQGFSMAIDALGRFLFVANKSTSDISMFQIDQATGKLTEVPASPFSAGPIENPNMAPASPVCLAAEKSGRFLYVGYQTGNFQGQGAVNEFLIDATNLQLLSLPGQPTLDIASSPIGLFADPKGLHLYVGLGLNQSTGLQDKGTNVYSIDPNTGQLTFTGLAGNALDAGKSIALDTQGRFFFDAWGRSQTFLDSAPVSPADGSAITSVSTLALGPGEVAVAMLTESTGKFLYVQEFTASYVYSIDQTTGALTQGAAMSRLNFKPGTAAADPLGPYLYSLQNDGVHGFLIDPQSGSLTEIPGSPFVFGPQGIGPLAISGAAVQAVSGPTAALFPSSEDFGSITLGESSSSRSVTLTNTGDQALSINSIGLAGSNHADFTSTPTCTPPALLLPNATCTISVVFSPTQAGARNASLIVSDNAPGSPQSVPLTGIGLAPRPAITLSPGTLSFAATTQGTASVSQVITVTSAGSAILHISAVLLGGSNPSDFGMTNTCNGAYAPNATCSISLVFTPLGAGLRTAAITINDDAPNSPQNIVISGTGIAAQPSATLAPSTLSFPATTQGTASSSQTVTLISSGSTALHVSSIALAGASPNDFTISSTCGGPYSPSATCTISVAFAPLAGSSRAATVSVSDDAPDSPQIIVVSGNANAAFTIVPIAPNGMSATVAAGQTATYSLQLIPGDGFTGSVSIACAGAPLAANCSAPAVQIANANPVPLTISVSTSGSSLLIPAMRSPGFKPASPELLIIMSFFVVLLLLLDACKNRRTARFTLAASVCLLFLLTLLHVSGCGGGATPAPALIVPPTVTPHGTSTLTITPAALSASGKPLQLSPIQLTLTVQ